MQDNLRIYSKLLFGKEDSNLWFNKKVHNELLRKIVSYLSSNLSEDNLEINEDEIQSIIHKFLNGKLKNTQFHAKRESSAFEQKRHDHLVEHITSKTPLVYYEIKTFIKPKENSLGPNDIYPDLIKLAIKKKEFPDCKVYFLLAGKKYIFHKAVKDHLIIKLPDKFSDNSSRASVILTKDFLCQQITHSKHKNLLKKMENIGISEISISPSRWKNFEGMSCLTWKLNKVK